MPTGCSARPPRGASGLLPSGTSCVTRSPGGGGGWGHKLLSPGPEFCPRGHTWRPGTATWHRFWSSGDGGRLCDGPFGEGTVSQLSMTSCPKAAGGHCCRRRGHLARPTAAAWRLRPWARAPPGCPSPSSLLLQGPGGGCLRGTWPGPRTAVEPGPGDSWGVARTGHGSPGWLVTGLTQPALTDAPSWRWSPVGLQRSAHYWRRRPAGVSRVPRPLAGRILAPRETRSPTGCPVPAFHLWRPTDAVCCCWAP